MKVFLPIRIAVTGILLAGTCAAAETSPTKKSKAAMFAEAEKRITSHFQKQKHYSPGDLITREQVSPVLKELRRQGWNSKSLESVSARLVPQGEFLAQQLDSPAGRKFMRRIAEYPQAYDRLDRLSRLIRGRKIVHDLIYEVGGEKMIEYLTTSSGGKAMGRMLSEAPHGKNFNKPTGRIYTVAMLLRALRKELTGEKS
jgi:hypothetical protein